MISLSPTWRFVVLLALYSGIMLASLVASYLLRFDFAIQEPYRHQLWIVALWVVPLKVACLALFGQFRTLLSYFSFPDAKRLVFALGVSAAGMFAIWYFVDPAYAPPRAVIVTDYVISLLALFGSRAAFRVLRENSYGSLVPGSTKKVLIIGAGASGAALCQEIHSRRGLGMSVMAFFDDSPDKVGTQIHGITVFGPPERIPELLPELNLQKAIIAMPSASSSRIKEVIAILNSCQLDHDILPSMSQLLEGHVTVSRLRHVELEDLLGREPVRLQTDSIRDILHGAVVMVTGGGGSIGSELCRQVASNRPAKLVLVERSESAAFVIEQELRGTFPWLDLDVQVADVRDECRVRALLAAHPPGVVFHAAAHKHVPLMEQQPAEALENNAIATALFSRWCAEAGVGTFVLISTDKAINPTSVMGATKRLAELSLRAHQASGKWRTRFASVRFGNVLGSSGSVIPIFKQQIARGGPVTVTHPDVMRYFMTIPEAVGLVIQTATLARGGEIFILDMGEQMKIVDMARQLIRLSGLEPDRDIAIAFTGLRPGEKLYEELLHHRENTHGTTHPKILRLEANPEEENGLLVELEEMTPAHRFSAGEVRKKLSQWVPEYTGTN